MWCETDGEKEDRGPNGDDGIEGGNGSDGKGEWSEMVWGCVEEGCRACLRKALEFEVKGKRKRRRPNKTWKTQVEKENKSVGLEKKDTLNGARWRCISGQITRGSSFSRSGNFKIPGSGILKFVFDLKES